MASKVSKNSKANLLKKNEITFSQLNALDLYKTVQPQVYALNRKQVKRAQKRF